MSDESKTGRWLAELKRRKVFRVAAVYLVGAWLLVQVAGTTFEPMGLPPWTLKLVITLAALGFPLACALAWAFDVTAKGIERTPRVTSADPAAPVVLEPQVLPAVAPPSAAAEAPDSVAILPFVDMSPGHDQEYFCDGIAEEIINSLCCIRDLRIASRTSSFQFKGRAADVREIGRALGVGAVLEGSVRKAGERVRITAQLVNTSDGYHLWSESFDRSLEDVFAIQSEIAQRLLQALQLTLSKRETEMLERGGTSNADAYDFYLRGRSYMHYGTSMMPAVGMFRRAIECDARFAQAHAGLANAIAIMGQWRLNATPAEVIDEAMAASRRALELEPRMPEAYLARACLFSMQGKDAEAVRDFDEAIRLNPASYYAHYQYGRHAFAVGRTEQAVELYEAADRLQPDEYQVLSMLYGALRKLGRTERVQEVGARAMRAIDRQLEVDRDDGRALQLGAVMAATLHLAGKARDLADRAMLARPNEFSTAYNLACAAAVMGDTDRALELLSQAVRFGRGNLGWIEHDPDFDNLRSDPRFDAILDRIRANPGAPPA